VPQLADVLIFLLLFHLKVDAAEAVFLIARLSRRVDDLLDRKVSGFDGLLAAEKPLKPRRLHRLQLLPSEILSDNGFATSRAYIDFVVKLNVLVVHFHALRLAWIDEHLSDQLDFGLLGFFLFALIFDVLLFHVCGSWLAL